MSDIFIGILIGAVIAAGALFFIFNKRLRELEDEVTDMKYIVAEKQPGGGYIFKNRKGEPILEL